MDTETDDAYYARRARQHLELAEAAANLGSKGIHQELARMYEARSRGEEFQPDSSDDTDTISPKD